MNIRRLLIACCAILPLALDAQEVPMALPVEDMIAKQDQAILDRQGEEIFKALDMLASPYRNSVVAIVAGDRLMACGMVVAPGVVVSKYSDLTRTRRPLAIVDADNRIHDMRVLGKAIENDVIFLEVPGLKAPVIPFLEPSSVEEGSMVFVYTPEGKVTHYGVISVDQRSLREQDQAFIGIAVNPYWKGEGAQIGGANSVVPGSPAHRAGLRKGDVIKKINGKEVDGILSLRTLLNEVSPGDKIEVVMDRGGELATVELVAGRRQQERSFPQRRLEQMNSMGNRMSLRRNNFPVVYQSDITLLPERAGSPVIDLDGKLVGMALSRAGRIDSYILPAWVIRELTTKVLQQRDKSVIPEAEAVDLL